MIPCDKKRKNLWRWMPPLLMAAAFWFVASDVKATHTNVLESEDVRITKHNMTMNPDVGATGTTEVCVFCHTPHGANPNLTGLAPLWNRTVPVDTTYTPYTAPNFEGSGTNAGRPKGVSLACLSCHDGTIAVDSLVNAPGSGGFEPLNRVVGTGVSINIINFTAGGIIVASSQNEGLRDSTDQNTDSNCSPYCGGIHDTLTTGSSGPEGAEPFPNLGTILGDDHPVGMQVPITGFNCDGGCGTSYDPQFVMIGANSSLEGGTDGTHVKFITKDGFMATDKRDRIRAYPSTGVAGAYYIECASCHNPHTPRVSFLRLPSSLKNGNTWVHIADPTVSIPSSWSSADSTFKWGNKPNSGSAICLSCHQK